VQSIGLVDLLIDELLNDIGRRIASQDIVENGEESQNAKKSVNHFIIRLID